MNRTRLLLLLPALALSLLTPGAAHAQAGPPTLSTHLRYHSVSWSYDGGEYGDESLHMSAPKGWTMALTAAHQGRFNDPTHTFLLAVDEPVYPGPSMRRTMAAKVADLQGTADLRIVQRSITVPKGGGEAVGRLAYSYTDATGAARLVEYRYRGQVVHGRPQAVYTVAVAGRAQDASGLRTLLHTAATSEDMPDCD